MSGAFTRKMKGDLVHTSVAGAGSFARRDEFLHQRVFESDLMYVEPVFFGFNLITDASNRTVVAAQKVKQDGVYQGT